MTNKNNTRGFYTQNKKNFAKLPHPSNKVALFLAALAIALVSLLLIRFKALSLTKAVKASELDTTEAISEIYEYIDSLNGFTDSQKEELNLYIGDYMKNHPTVSEDELSVVYQFIDDKYKANKTYLETVKTQLENQLSSTSTSDTNHYSELSKLIKELDFLLTQSNNTDAEYRLSFNEAMADLQAYTDKHDDGLSETIKILTSQLETKFDTQLKTESNSLKESLSQLSENTDATTNDLQSSIDKLNQRTTDVEGTYEFDFGYQDGCYGYYLTDGSFRPF